MVIISAIAHCSIRHNGPDFFGYKYDYGKGDDLNCMDHVVILMNRMTLMLSQVP